MPLNNSRLADAIEAAYNDNAPDGDAPVTGAQLKAIHTAVATAIIDEIKQGTVTVPAAGLAAPTGPVTGSATGSIS